MKTIRHNLLFLQGTLTITLFIFLGFITQAILGISVPHILWVCYAILSGALVYLLLKIFFHLDIAYYTKNNSIFFSLILLIGVILQYIENKGIIGPDISVMLSIMVLPCGYYFLVMESDFTDELEEN